MSWLGQARKRNQRIGSIANDQGDLVPRRLDLRNAGYLERLKLYQRYTWQMGTAAASSADFFAEYGGMLQRITLISNSVGMLYDVSGEMAKLISALDMGYEQGAAVVNPSPNSFTTAAAAGTAAAANVWALDVPVAINLANKPWPVGLYQTALNSLEIALEVRQRPLRATVGTPGSGLYVPAGTTVTTTDLAGDIEIQQVYFDPIADQASQPSLGFIHQWREFQVPLTADGDLEIRLAPSNLYMRALYWALTGTAGTDLTGSTAVTALKLVYGANFAPFDETDDQASARMRRNYGNAAWPVGFYAHDFVKDSHTERDFINSAATTDLRAIMTTSGGTYVGSYVKVAVEQLIPLIVPAAGAGNVQGVG